MLYLPAVHNPQYKPKSYVPASHVSQAETPMRFVPAGHVVAEYAQVD